MIAKVKVKEEEPDSDAESGDECCGDPNLCTCVIDISSPDRLERDFRKWLNTSCLNSSRCPKLEGSTSIDQTSLPASPIDSQRSSVSPQLRAFIDRPDGRRIKKAGRTPLNTFGRCYIPGRPLHLDDRRLIAVCADSGLCVGFISRMLRVSHGCVSKIIRRYRTTGILTPAPYKRRPREKKSDKTATISVNSEEASSTSAKSDDVRDFELAR